MADYFIWYSYLGPASGILPGIVASIRSGPAIMHPISVLVTNITFTSLVVGRLVYYQRNLRKLLGSRSSSEYTTIAAMIVESAFTNIVFQTLALASTAHWDRLISIRIFNVNLLGQTQVRT